MGSRLIIENLNYYYKKNHLVISDLSLALSAGQVLAVFGKNGSGKSTFLRILATLIEPKSGKVRLDDFDYSGSNYRLKQLVSLAPGSPTSFYDTLTGLQNLEYFFHLKRPDLEFPNSDIARLAKGLNLENELKREFRTYSTGMRQKLGIIRALSTNPILLLLDEPTSNLDSESETAFLKLMLELKSEKSCIQIWTSPKSQAYGIEDLCLSF